MILLAVLSMLIFGSSAYESEEVPYSSELKREAFELLDNGIDSTNSDRVLELLLQYESGYVPSDYVGARSESNPSTKKFFYLSIFVFIIGVVKPKSTIGLGKHQARYRFLVAWVRLITYTLPAALIITPFWQRLTEWIYKI